MGVERGTVRLGLGMDPDPLFGDLIAAVAAAAGELGIEASMVGAPVQAGSVHRLLLVGRPGRFRDLLGGDARVPVTVWTGEPLPAAPRGPRDDRRPRGALARMLARPVGATVRSVRLPAGLDHRRVALATDRLTRANLDELTVAAAGGADLVVTSRDRATALAGWGLAVRVVPFGYHPLHAGPLTPAQAGSRDVPLLLLGSRAGHTRRAASVHRLRAAGAEHGLRVEESSWGAERAVLLRRTRVMLDVHRVPGNFVGLRLLLSLAAGVALVTEPMTDPWPFVPGVHFIEAPLEGLLDEGIRLAADAPARAKLVDAGQALLRDELTMRASLERVLTGASGAAPNA